MQTFPSPAADPGTRPVLAAADLTKSYDGRAVLTGISLAVAPGMRLGLVGENGIGKSTLLRLLAGAEAPDSGEVSVPAELGFGHQEVPYPGDMTLTGAVEDALDGVRSIERRLAEHTAALDAHPEDAAVLAAYGESLDAAEQADIWDADRRAGLVLDGLGLGGVEPDRRIDAMSGGQRARLALAALLIRRPRALLLDEPTNHLDDDAVVFLESYLRSLPGAVVVASHDRTFLDEVCTGLLDLDPSRGGAVYYGGAYSHYLREKRLEREAWEEQFRTEQGELRSLREAVRTTARQVGHFRPMKDKNKMMYDASGAKVEKQISRRVRNAQRRLDELDRDQVRKPPKPLAFRSALTGGTGTDGMALMARGIEIPGRLRLPHLDLPADGRLLVTGPNGAGKSTLLQVLARRLDPGAGGQVQWQRGAAVALLEQDVVFTRGDLSPRVVYANLVGTDKTGNGAPSLGELGLVAPRDLDRPVGSLSVGQRRRLALALLVANAPQVLLLDEPTNHISLRLAEELEDALRTAPGAVVIATHDRWMRRNWSGPELRLNNGIEESA
ncbi:macrolide transport system ATP-binding/permease protein [Murinocardiopsis flavida]|uniref:Macrolide transport system ATP-binding/permease protein n=1 Tax=Murinocardiopsis flavida TaxID=645275 RepID=A0A2P8CVG6_9ACTN|nr:ATP-binding cassette domain-containing protein [Murinocardiopsis flavida]PSK88964.1 macrolide transport system ATP-binding/permease protein [Murinocardiopsis flavida]